MGSRTILTDIGRTARRRLTLRSALGSAVVLVLVYGITREVNTVGAVALGLVVVETIQILGETPSIDDRWIGFGIGSFVTVLSLVWLGYELTVVSNTGGPTWFPALTALAGVWFLLDARSSDRTYGDEPDDDMGFTEIMTVMNHSSLVVEELKEGPKTVAELAEACDLTESRVREALEVGTDDGAIYRVDSDSKDGAERYALDESMMGPTAFVRLNGKRLLNRLARPFR